MQIPDHWFVINGMDFGWTHPQAHVQLLWDKDSDTFYVTQAWKRAETSSDEAWGAVKPWAKGVPVSWPHDGEHPDRGGYGVQQKQHYANAGFKMLLERAQWPDKSISVESGLYEINNLMRKGRWKVFRGLRDYFDEHNQYHRNDKGQIVKVRDDLMDAVRYAYMMRRFAIRYGDRCRDEFAQLEAMRESAWQPAVSSVGY